VHFEELMRFTISREKLQEGLAAVAASIPGKTTLPVLANILVETTERGIRFSGTDLDIHVSHEVQADVERAGGITIPAKKLQELARELPPSPVKIESAGEQKVSLECGRAKFKLNGLSKDDFPQFPAIKFGDGWRVKSADVRKLIRHTAYAVSTEESRPILNGVLWELKPERMRMVATNGHRLAKMDIAVPGHTQSSDLIVMPKALDQVSRLFPDEEELEVARGDNHLAFKSPLTTIFTRLIEGPYPNYEQVIPKDNDRVAVADKEALASALRRMATVASDQTHRIKLSFNAGMLKFQVNTPDLGDGQDEIPVQYQGDPMDIGFNGAYLLEILRNIPTSDVRLTFKAPERAATVEPEGWSDPAQYLTILMPLRLSD
jgi:DNA polymerase III subunit beta